MKKYSRFFNEIFTSPMILSVDGLNKYMPFIKAFHEGNFIDLPERAPLKMGLFDEWGFPVPEKKDETVNGIAVIKVPEILTRAGSWWDAGSEEIAALMLEAFDDPSIKAIVFDENCYGGSTDALFPFTGLLKKKNKPCFAAVNGNSFSLGYFKNVLCCDKIFAVDKMAKVGSIGVMAELMDRSKMYEDYGIKLITVYPPESSWKNKPQREAIAGNTDLLIKEELSPWAKHFQETVKANRPNLNETATEGTLEGRTFFANYGEATAMMNGLIDGVMPMDEIIQYAFNYNQNTQLKQLFTNK